MQVLVKNIYCADVKHGLNPYFWDSDSFEIGPHFSMSSLLDLTDSLGLSPYFVLDAKLAFMISQLGKGNIYIRGIGELASTAALMKAGNGYVSGDQERLKKYISEYLPSDPLSVAETYQQVLTFGETDIDSSLWEKLSPGGFYYLGTRDSSLKLSAGKFEAFGKLWPSGEPTEFGWRFGKETPELSGFEFAKIKKSV